MNIDQLKSQTLICFGNKQWSAIKIISVCSLGNQINVQDFTSFEVITKVSEWP